MSLRKISYQLIQFITILIVIDIVLFVFTPQQWLYQSIASTLDRPLKADAIVVLFNRFGDYHSMGPESLRRANYGIKLFKDGYAAHIIFAGGSRPSRNLYGPKLMAHFAQECGVPPEKIHYEVKSNDSISNWEESHRILKEHQWHSVLLVSSPLHLQRVKKMINHHGINVYYVPVPYEGCDPPITPFDHWFSVHYHSASYLLYCLLPSSTYRNLINALRH